MEISKRRVAIYAMAAVIITVFVGLTAAGLRFARYRNGYCNIRLSYTKAEVMYRLGYPPAVYGKTVKGPFGPWSLVYFTDRSKFPANAMPKGKKVMDFDQWSYTGVPDIGPSGRLDITFQKTSGQVQEISCYDTSARSCPSLAEISIGTTEEELRSSLGQPDKQTLDGVSKIIVYKKLGLEFSLAKDKVYEIALLRPARSKWYVALVHIKAMVSF